MNIKGMIVDHGNYESCFAIISLWAVKVHKSNIAISKHTAIHQPGSSEVCVCARVCTIGTNIYTLTHTNARLMSEEQGSRPL